MGGAIVALFQCSCGVRVEMEPRFGDVITSVSHLHRSTRLDGTAAVVRMEEIRGPGAVESTHPAESTPSHRGRRVAPGTSPAHTAVSGEPAQVLIGRAS